MTSGDEEVPFEYSPEMKAMLQRSIQGAKAFDHAASEMSIKIPLLDIFQKTPSCFVDDCTSVKNELATLIKNLKQSAEFMRGGDGLSHQMIESLYQKGYFACNEHANTVPDDYDPTILSTVKCGLRLRPGQNNQSFDEWSIPSLGDKPLPSTRICDIDIPIREGTNWPYTDEGPVLCSLSHAALHRRSVKQRRNRSSRLGGGFETNSNRVGEHETGKRKSTEGTSRHKGNASFRLPPALIGARKTEVDPTSDIRTAEMESFFDQTPLAATYLSKEKALECTQCFTVDSSYPLTGDVQSKRMWHSSEAGYKAREKLRIFGGYVCGQPRCESTRALDLLRDSHQPRTATCKNPTECRVTFALTTGLEADWPYTTTVWKQDGTQSTYYQCSAWCNAQSIASEASKLASSTLMQHFTVRRLTPADLQERKAIWGRWDLPPGPLRPLQPRIALCEISLCTVNRLRLLVTIKNSLVLMRSCLHLLALVMIEMMKRSNRGLHSSLRSTNDRE
ncbi:hypothetical protein J008_04763 [Cryptococcus neoformans]|nr:hypothetical protein J008_04763 [Cryptococcus neoformans var. grubii]